MSIRRKEEHRDDMYSLDRQGAFIDEDMVGDRLGRLDRPHIFGDGDGGKIFPASKLRADRCTQSYSGVTLRHGPPHSHDNGHEHHIREVMPEPADDLIRKFRTKARGFRDERREKRGW